MDRRSFLGHLAALPVVLFAPGGKPDRAPSPKKDTVKHTSWGYLSNGQLDHTTSPSATDFEGPLLTRTTGWEQLAGGTNWWLGLKGGVPFHWGANDRGQRGDGTTNSTATTDKPPQAMALTGITSIAATDDAALMLNGTTGDLYGTGHRFDLGVSAGIGNQTTPTVVLASVKMVACGAHFTIAVKNDNTVWFTGDGWVRGDGTNTNAVGVWVQIPSISGPFTQISAGQTHAIFLRSGLNALGLGQNSTGELGLGNMSTQYAVVDLGCQPSWVSCGGDTTLWILSGTLYFTGWNGIAGQGGQGSTSPAFIDTRVSIALPGGRTPSKAYVARESLGAGCLATDGSFSAWGNQNSGWFGSQTVMTTPGLPDGLIVSTPLLCETGPYQDLVAGDFSVFGKQPSGRAWSMIVGA